MPDKPEVKEEETAPPKPEEGKEKQGLSKEDVEALLAKARQEEKDKLYGQLDELKNTTKEVQEALRQEREEKERIRKEAEAKAEEERKAKLSAEEILQEGLKKIEEQLASEREARARLEERIHSDKLKEQLAAYRLEKISEAKGEIIPEIVRGSSEAEIDASITVAKARYVQLVEELKVESAQTVKSNMPRPASPDTEPLEERELQNQIDNFDIDVALYAKDPKYRAETDAKRKALQDQVGAAYARSVGRA